MSAGFDAEQLIRKYHFLEALPETLYSVVVSLPHGTLTQRVNGILTWRNSFLQGILPNREWLSWPDPALTSVLIDTLTTLNIVRFCKQQPALTDKLLLDICVLIENYYSAITSQFERTLRRLLLREQELNRNQKRQRQKIRKPQRIRQSFSDRLEIEHLGHLAEQMSELDSEQMERLILEAQRLAREEIGRLESQRFFQQWEEPARIWNELAELFDELAQLMEKGWNLSPGLLTSQGWDEIIRLRKLLEQLPQLRKLLRTLGRTQSAANDQRPAAENIFLPVKVFLQEQSQGYHTFAPLEARGITHSDDVTRMLPCESSFLGHPQLKMLWHARRLEQVLLTYHVLGVFSEQQLTEKELIEAHKRPECSNPLEQGPIMVCLDTSGSMQGIPETLAKALTLEAMRIAHQEKRACYLYAFGGPKRVIEHELSLTEKNLSQFLAFLVLSFHGGTDIEEPFVRALKKLEHHQWRSADILLITDGEFPVPVKIVAAVNKAREDYQLRVHGILLGERNSPALVKICDPLHHFNDFSELVLSAS